MGRPVCFSDFVPTGIKYADNKSYSATETYGSVIQKLFAGRISDNDYPCYVFERSGIIYVVQGKEPNASIEITPNEIDYSTYSRTTANGYPL